jgi:DNA-directed RNA polymerase subunit RPC12/RpoP
MRKYYLSKSLNLEELKMEDKTLVCKDCGKEFIFTVGEQEFYKEKGFENEPVRCGDCRRARKQQNNRR